jgi:hypothetical protein
MAPSPAGPGGPRQSLIPPDVISYPTQRIYLLSLLVVAQAWKFTSTQNLYVWLVFDAFILGLALPSFRVSRLTWGVKGSLVAVALFWALDWAILGHWSSADIFNALPGVVALKGEFDAPLELVCGTFLVLSSRKHVLSGFCGVLNFHVTFY